MEITRQSDARGGRFTATNQNQELGHLDYTVVAPSVVDAHHTFVDDAARGQGVAEQLLNALVAFAQTEHYTIVPSCSYVAKKLPRSHPELVAKG